MAHGALFGRAFLYVLAFNGVFTGLDPGMIAFDSPSDACWFACTTQQQLLQAPWSEEILAEKDTPETEVVADGRLIWRGPRVRIGIHRRGALVPEEPARLLLVRFLFPQKSPRNAGSRAHSFSLVMCISLVSFALRES